MLYEMLTATRPFAGETQTDIMAAVIHHEPDWSRLPGSTPPPVRLLLRRCLRKDPRLQLQAIGDARVIIEEILSGVVPADAVPARRGWSTWWLTAGAAGVLAGATIAGLVAWLMTSAAEPLRPVTRFVITLPPGQQLDDAAALALSADGSQLAYVAMDAANGNNQLHLRAMDGIDARPIAGTEGATSPFFSPDGQWLGFFAGGSLKKVPLRGGAPVNLANVTNPRGGAWIDEQTIAFASYLSTLLRVPDTGGTPQSHSVCLVTRRTAPELRETRAGGGRRTLRTPPRRCVHDAFRRHAAGVHPDAGRRRRAAIVAVRPLDGVRVRGVGAARDLRAGVSRPRRAMQVSNDGGNEPLWSASGRELFYRSVATG